MIGRERKKASERARKIKSASGPPDPLELTISPKIGIISRIRHYVPRSTLVLLYNTLILPHLSYCLEIWGNTYRTLLEPLIILQKKLARLITFSDYQTHSAPLFNQLRILDIHKLCKFQTCMFVYDLQNNRYAHNINHYITNRLSHSYPTRSALSCNIPIPKVNLTICQKNFKYALPKHWNSLPNKLKNIHKRHEFKKCIKTHLFS